MAVVFENWEEEMMKKKITEKAIKALGASAPPPCKDLLEELKRYVIEACMRCVRQVSIAEADPGEVQNCLLHTVEELANMYFGGISKKMLEQLKQCLGVEEVEELLKACSGYEDEA